MSLYFRKRIGNLEWSNVDETWTNCLVRIVPADGLASFCAWSAAGTVMANFGSVYKCKTGYLEDSHGINSLWLGDDLWRHRSRLSWTWVMPCCLMAPSLSPNNCWFIGIEVMWHLPKSDFTASAEVIFFNITSLKIKILKFLPHSRRTNELTHWPLGDLGKILDM